MRTANFHDDLVNSIVGSGTQFRGNIVLSGIFRIDGDFIGTIRNDGKVIIGRTARSECSIEATTVVIGGLFRGDIWATGKVFLLSSSIIIGTISTPHLVVEQGCLLDGTLSVEPSNATMQRQKVFTTFADDRSRVPADKQIRSL